MTRTAPEEMVVYDGCEACPYLPDRDARMPLRLPSAKLNGAEFDQRLAEGDRRSGVYLYRTACPTCSACEPIRVIADQFEPSKTMKRVKKRGDSEITVVIGKPVVDAIHVDLFNLHRRERGLDHDHSEVDAFGYEMFLAETCCETFEMSYYLKDRLIGAAICDRGSNSISAVYCYFDPSESKLSPGVYSVLKQIELCQQERYEYLYLGLFIAESPHMSYKARYQPHQRLVNGEWLSQ